MQTFGRKDHDGYIIYMLSFQLCYWQTCSAASDADFASMVVSNAVKAEGCDNLSRLKVKPILQLEVKDF